MWCQVKDQQESPFLCHWQSEVPAAPQGSGYVSMFKHCGKLWTIAQPTRSRPSYSLLPPKLAQMMGSQHLASLVLGEQHWPGTTALNAHQHSTCPICLCRLLQWQLLCSWPLSSRLLRTKFGSTSKKRTTQCNTVVPGEASTPTFLRVLSWKLHWGHRSDTGHRCPHVQP